MRGSGLGADAETVAVGIGAEDRLSVELELGLVEPAGVSWKNAQPVAAKTSPASAAGRNDSTIADEWRRIE